MGNYVRIGAVEGGDSKRSVRGAGETPLERELGGGGRCFGRLGTPNCSCSW